MDIRWIVAGIVLILAGALGTHDVAISGNFSYEFNQVILNVTNLASPQETVNVSVYYGYDLVFTRNVSLGSWESTVLYTGLSRPGEYIARADVPGDANLGNNEVVIDVPEYTDVAVSVYKDPRGIVVWLENTGNTLAEGTLNITGNVSFTRNFSVPPSGHQEIVINPDLPAGEYKVFANSSKDVDLSNNYASFIVGLDQTYLGVTDAWISDGKFQANVTNSGNETLVVPVQITLAYRNQPHEYYTGNITLGPGKSKVVYAELHSGFLEYARIDVDPLNNVTGPWPGKSRILVVESYLDFNPPEIEVLEHNKTVYKGEDLVFLARISDENLVKYGVLWRFEGEENWINESYYAPASDDYLEYTIIPNRTGTIELKFWALDDFGNYKESQTLEADVKLKTYPGGSEVIWMDNIVTYQLKSFKIARDYKYNPETDVTKVTTRITPLKSGKTATVDDWIPPTFVESMNRAVFDPDPESISGRVVEFSIPLNKGEVKLVYVFPGRVDPGLVKAMPAPNITLVSASEGEEPNVKIITYNVGGIPVTRAIRYLKDENQTVIITEIEKLDPGKEYIIVDEIPYDVAKKASQVSVAPNPTKLVSDSPPAFSWNITGTDKLYITYRIHGQVSWKSVDKFNAPFISVPFSNQGGHEIHPGNVTTNQTQVKLNRTTSPLTGLVSLVRKGSLVYAVTVILAGILAFLYAYLERTGSMVARRPGVTGEILTEEDVIADHILWQ